MMRPVYRPVTDAEWDFKFVRSRTKSSRHVVNSTRQIVRAIKIQLILKKRNFIINISLLNLVLK